jgi:hypothetical protein
MGLPIFLSIENNTRIRDGVVNASALPKFEVSVGGVVNSDKLEFYLGLLVQGMNDFDASEEIRGEDFSIRSPDVGSVPSSSTLRLRMDTHVPQWVELASEFKRAMLSAKHATGPVDFGALPCGYLSVDWDSFVMNNSGTQKKPSDAPPCCGRLHAERHLFGLFGLLPGAGLAPKLQPCRARSPLSSSGIPAVCPSKLSPPSACRRRQLAPWLVDDRVTIWQATSAAESLMVMVIFYGVALVLPVIIGNTVCAYRVFWGKSSAIKY